MLRVLSLGLGVQSTTISLMVKHGDLPSIDCGIFADTGEEPMAVYRHLKWMTVGAELPFPIHVVRAWEGYGKPRTKRRLGDQIIESAIYKRGAGSHARPPLFTLDDTGKRGMVRRQCTFEYKILPIERKVRELLGLKKGQRWPKIPSVEQWIGISVEEAIRVKPSQRSSVVMRWPLIEKHMTRTDCFKWLSRHGYETPPKSACTFCPFRSDAAWRDVKKSPPDWNRALEVDGAIRNGLPGLDADLYLHASRKPLSEVDIEERVDNQLNMFNNDCSGMCGV